MYSAALLLMLVVRIYADNMEGPTGNDKRMRRDVCVFWGGLRRIAFKVDRRGWGAKLAVFYSPRGSTAPLKGGLQLLIKSCLRWFISHFNLTTHCLIHWRELSPLRAPCPERKRAQTELPPPSAGHHFVAGPSGAGDHCFRHPRRRKVWK